MEVTWGGNAGLGDDTRRGDDGRNTDDGCDNFEYCGLGNWPTKNGMNIVK